jgi:D-glycero-alpha-D-manno-heptose-7-phosphate kinase
VHIESSVPTRIDLAGGTLDIWPLHLIHERGQTIDAAISLRARGSLQPRRTRGLTLGSGGTGRRVDVSHWSELQHNHELRLPRRLLDFSTITSAPTIEPDGLQVKTRVTT